MEPVILNGFKFIKCQDTEPPYLVHIHNHKTYVIYRSTYNTLLFVVFNTLTNQWCIFTLEKERDNILEDLIFNIESYLG